MFLIASLNNQKITYTKDTIFKVEIGKDKGSYKTKWTFTGDLPQAVKYFNGLNIGYGYKKRLICDTFNKRVLARIFS